MTAEQRKLDVETREGEWWVGRQPGIARTWVMPKVSDEAPAGYASVEVQTAVGVRIVDRARFNASDWRLCPSLADAINAGAEMLPHFAQFGWVR